jgi:dephospho-CoA kinase
MSTLKSIQNHGMVIGLTGKKGCGKDTVGDYLVRKYGFERMAFADALKQVCQTVFDLTMEQMTDTIKKEQMDERWDTTPRHLMQIVGTQLFRDKLTECFPHLKGSIWVGIIKQKILRSSKNIVLTDVRFENEAEMVRQFNGKLIQITRTDNNQSDKHVSENIHIQTNYMLENNQTVEELYQEMDKIIAECDKYYEQLEEQPLPPLP